MSFSQEILEQLATKFGTPTYGYSEAILSESFKRFSSLAPKARVCFAVKACSNLSILKAFKELGAGFDIVSGGELRRVLAIGGNPEHVVFSGVGKDDDELTYAIESGIGQINVESESELERIKELAKSLSKVAQIAIRVNPSVDVETHPYLATGEKDNKFGIPLERVSDLYDDIVSSENVKLVGLACHIGSQIADLSPLRDAYSQVIKLAESLDERGAELQTLDLGGGFCISYSGSYTPLDTDAFKDMIAELTSDLSYQVIFEPGKYLIAEAGVLLTEVTHVKSNGEKRFVVINAGMNDLIRPPLYDAKHRTELIGGAGNSSDSLADIVGPVCESGCFFRKDMKFPDVKRGDKIAIYDAGAYCFTMASNYNTRRLPAEVLIKSNGELKLIRPRQEYEEIYGAEMSCL